MLQRVIASATPWVSAAIRPLLAHTYLFDVNTGEERFKLTPSDTLRIDVFFGVSVAIRGSTAIVGAYEDDTSGTVSGSAYVFDVATGAQRHKLTATDAAPGDKFGTSVAISGNIAIVGASGDDDAGSDSGSAYLFNLTTGQQLHKLTALDAAARDEFGRSAGISGNTAIVGSFGDDHAGERSGSVYLFDVSTGEQRLKLTASDAAAGDWFGHSVGISGNTAIVGAFNDDDAGGNSGSAYVFIPEPTALTLATLALLGFAARRRRRPSTSPARVARKGERY